MKIIKSQMTMGELIAFIEYTTLFINPCIRILLSLIHISEPTRLGMISYAVFCLKKKKIHITEPTRLRTISYAVFWIKHSRQQAHR